MSNDKYDYDSTFRFRRLSTLVRLSCLNAAERKREKNTKRQVLTLDSAQKVIVIDCKMNILVFQNIHNDYLLKNQDH